MTALTEDDAKRWGKHGAIERVLPKPDLKRGVRKWTIASDFDHCPVECGDMPESIRY